MRKGFVKYLFIIPVLLSVNLLIAQNQNLLKNYLTVDEGFSHNEVTSIVQDNDGFIWIGTRGSLNRYDGYQFKIFNQNRAKSGGQPILLMFGLVREKCCYRLLT